VLASSSDCSRPGKLHQLDEMRVVPRDMAPQTRGYIYREKPQDMDTGSYSLNVMCMKMSAETNRDRLILCFTAY
jgi:hypothetical protein